jgi:hypothetical protein
MASDDSNSWFMAVPTPSASQNENLGRTMVNDNAPYRPDSDHASSFSSTSINEPNSSVFPSISTLTTSSGLCSLLAFGILIFIIGLYLLHQVAIFYGFVSPP